MGNRDWGSEWGIGIGDRDWDLGSEFWIGDWGLGFGIGISTCNLGIGIVD